MQILNANNIMQHLEVEKKGFAKLSTLIVLPACELVNPRIDFDIESLGRSMFLLVFYFLPDNKAKRTISSRSRQVTNLPECAASHTHKAMKIYGKNLSHKVTKLCARISCLSNARESKAERLFLAACGE
jgi:hypothetical protein